MQNSSVRFLPTVFSQEKRMLCIELYKIPFTVHTNQSPTHVPLPQFSCFRDIQAKSAHIQHRNKIVSNIDISLTIWRLHARMVRYMRVDTLRTMADETQCRYVR